MICQIPSDEISPSILDAPRYTLAEKSESSARI